MTPTSDQLQRQEWTGGVDPCLALDTLEVGAADRSEPHPVHFPGLPQDLPNLCFHLCHLCLTQKELLHLKPVHAHLSDHHHPLGPLFLSRHLIRDLQQQLRIANHNQHAPDLPRCTCWWKGSNAAESKRQVLLTPEGKQDRPLNMTAFFASSCLQSSLSIFFTCRAVYARESSLSQVRFT